MLLAELPPAELDAYLGRVPPGGAARRARSPTRDRLRAALGEARRQGWAMVDQELEDGVRSIATPLRGRDGRAVAALNCSTHAGRVGLRELRTEFVPALLATAAEINARLAAR